MGLRHIPKAFVIVDALDEMDRGVEMQSFLDNLAELARWRPAQTKIVMTSRPVAYVEVALRRANAIDIRLLENFVDVDIATFVAHQLASSTIDAENQQRIKTAVPGRANGLFLYAKLAMDAFLQPGADINNVLKNLPQDLNVMYNNLLEEHARRSGLPEKMQLLIMKFVTHATRPLRLREIASMINITQYPPEKRNLDEMKGMVRMACGPLLEILPDETVSVIHHSLTEFLTGITRDEESGGYPILHAANTHHELTLLCLKYLDSEILSKPDLPSDPHIRSGKRQSAVCDALQHDTFARYAGENWFVHARKAAIAGADQSNLTPILDDIFAAEKLADILTGSGLREAHQPERYGMEPMRFTPVYAASILGLREYVKILLSRPGVEVNQGSNPKESPLCYASSHGYADIVEALLKAGANTAERDKKCFSGLAPLHYAVSHNRVEVIKLLLDAGADPTIATDFNDPSSRGHHDPSAFEMACTCGHFAALAAFLPYIQSKKLMSNAVSWIVPTKRADMLALVLASPLVDVNEQIRGLTPLLLASAYRQASMVKMLLQAGADITIVYDSDHYRSGHREAGQTVLHLWAALQPGISSIPHHYRSSDFEPEATMEVFNLLVKAGADVNERNQTGSTPLHYVQDALAARLLIDAGADVNAVNKRGETLLHLTGDRATVQYLVEEANASLNLDNTQDPPLLMRLRQGGADIAEQIQMFLDHGADPNVVDASGHTALHIVVQQSRRRGDKREDARVPLLRRFLQAGLDVNARDKDGRTALHLLEFGTDETQDNAELLSAMQSSGADINAKDNLGQTPLFFKLDGGMRYPSYSLEIIKVLEHMSQIGARVDTCDSAGRTLLHAVAAEDNIKTVQWLVDHGVDPKATDNNGNTLFHAAVKPRSQVHYGQSSNHSFDDFRNFISLGLDPEQANSIGQTPLHILSTVTPGGIRKLGNENSTGSTTLFDWFLDIQQDIDAADKRGVTALHFACTFSEYMARRLLEAGANPLKATKEGLNGLHLAARAKQVNILGMMLETLSTRSHEDSDWLEALNKSAEHHRSPLFYACASGRPESVKLLLNNGVIPPLNSYQHSALQGAVSFEEELQNWPGGTVAESRCMELLLNPNRSRTSFWWENKDEREVGSVTLSDTFRKAEYSEFSPSERIDEILEMLSAHHLISEDHLEEAIQEATSKKAAYTLECLLRAGGQIGVNYKGNGTEDITDLMGKRREIQQPLQQKISEKKPFSVEDFKTAMRMRFFSVVADECSFENSQQAMREGRYSITLLDYLVSEGHWHLVRNIVGSGCTVTEDRPQLAAAKKMNFSDILETLLVTACQRPISNMEIVKVLVEDFHVSVNRPQVEKESYYGDRTGPPHSALHALAVGTHWWQTEEAMPYLLAHGADVNLRDKRGLTPLNASLDRWRTAELSLNKRAIKVLLDHGADVNSADERGVSCLERAIHDSKLLQLLLKNATNVPSKCLISAIGARDIGTLETLLKAGANPNGRDVPSEEKTDPRLMRGSYLQGAVLLDLQGNERFPLHYALSASTKNEKQDEMLELLLKYGADPLAKYEKTTLLHQLFAEGVKGPVHRLLEREIPGLDPNCTDAQGATLFHLACQGSEPGDTRAAQRLLDLGADIYAKDKKGCNSLNYLVRTCSDSAKIDLVRHVANSAPELVNERDNKGRTAFLLAIKQTRNYSFCFDDKKTTLLEILMDAGADASIPDLEGNTALHIVLGEITFYVESPTITIAPDTQAAIDKLLAMPGLDINATNNAGESPVFAYLRKGSVFAYKLEPSEQARHEIAVLDMLDALGADWTLRNKTGETMMHVAVQRGGGSSDRESTVAKVQYVMNKGVDPAAEDEEYKTALDVAAAVGAKSVLKLFAREDQEKATKKVEDNKRPPYESDCDDL